MGVPPPVSRSVLRPRLLMARKTAAAPVTEGRAQGWPISMLPSLYEWAHTRRAATSARGAARSRRRRIAALWRWHAPEGSCASGAEKTPQVERPSQHGGQCLAEDGALAAPGEI